MAEIKLLEYSQGNKFLDFYKKDSIENEKNIFVVMIMIFLLFQMLQ